MQDMMEKHLLEMIEIFSKEGHSGFSASYAINGLERLLRFLPLTPLTGEDEEWTEIVDGQFQNKRCSSVFKNLDGKSYMIDGKVFSDDGGETWWTCRNSRVPVEFPYDVPAKPEHVMLYKEKENENA